MVKKGKSEENVIESVSSDVKEDIEEIKKDLKKRQNRQVFIAIILMIVVVLAFFIIPRFVKNYINSFEYGNIDFQKTKQGDIVYYSTNIPLVNKNYMVIGNYPVNLQTDPRKMDFINTEINGGNITFIKNNIVYITVQSDSPRCEYNAVAVARLASFLNGFAGFNVKGALDNKTYAEDNKLPYATCKDNKNNTVIYFKSSNETSIKKINNECYELTYKECEILPVSEKFELMILENYMSYFRKK